MAGGLGLAFAGVVLPASAAHAAWAPSCVEVFGPPATQSALVQNDCSTTQKVRVIVAWGPDSSCVTLQAGYEFTYRWSIGSYDGVALC
ncbi:hypothetical protein GCM10010432_62090 [Catellatospora methionotrophica]